MTRIRPATPGDVPAIVGLIRGLADYERLAEQCAPDASALSEHLFGSPARAEVRLAEHAGTVVGFALFFHTYSSFLTKPGLYLEDLFVVPELRGRGIGSALLANLAELAAERGCGRLEWSVLTWNEPAIRFYERLGAVAMGSWQVYRLAGQALVRLADSSKTTASPAE